MHNIIVIGGSSGIGLAFIQKHTDCKIVNVSRTACPVAGVTNIIADVTKPNALMKAFDRIDAADTLVYAAGTSLAAPLERTTQADYRAIVDTNLVGAIEATRLALPLLRASGRGRIVYAASTGAVVPIAFDACYSASKAALVMLARALEAELAGSPVKATAVVIGGTRTRFTFKRKIYADVGEPYERNLKSACDALIKTEQTGYAATTVADGITRVINAKNPPPVVTLGLKNKLMTAVYKILPMRAKCAVDKAFFGIKTDGATQ